MTGPAMLDWIRDAASTQSLGVGPLIRALITDFTEYV
jgi:hypothetical protein